MPETPNSDSSPFELRFDGPNRLSENGKLRLNSVKNSVLRVSLCAGGGGKAAGP
jgi:hypothetical protein